MSTLAILAATYGYCVLSGLLPFVNAELYLLAASAAVSREMALGVVIAGTLGQMTAKVAMYLAGRGMVKLPGARLQRMVAEAEAWAARRPNMGGGLIFVSASTGFPPFYIMSIACGVVRTNLAQFATVGFVGRFLRFGIVVLFPQIAKALRDAF
jgi:membrane protein YqaA with SNARE-associated domain